MNNSEIMKNALLALAVAVFMFGAYMVGSASSPKLGSISSPTYLQAMGTNSAISVTSSGVQVLATSTSRQFAEISATSTVYCNLSDAKPSLAGGGVTIGLGQPLILTSKNLYIGAIRCIAPSTTHVSVTQN